MFSDFVKNQVSFYWTEDSKDVDPFSEEHTIHAKLNGNEIGHLSISFVNPNHPDLDSFYGFLKYLDRYTGMVAVDPDKNDEREIAYQLMKDIEPWSEWKSIGGSDEMSDDEVEYYLEKGKEEYEEEFEKFKEFRVGKPYVCFSEVNREYRRKGVATSMYLKVAKKFAEKYGFKLFADGIQTYKAEKVWDYFMDNENIPTGTCESVYDYTRKFIDFR